MSSKKYGALLPVDDMVYAMFDETHSREAVDKEAQLLLDSTPRSELAVMDRSDFSVLLIGRLSTTTNSPPTSTVIQIEEEPSHTADDGKQGTPTTQPSTSSLLGPVDDIARFPLFSEDDMECLLSETTAASQLLRATCSTAAATDDIEGSYHRVLNLLHEVKGVLLAGGLSKLTLGDIISGIVAELPSGLTVDEAAELFLQHHGLSLSNAKPAGATPASTRMHDSSTAGNGGDAATKDALRRRLLKRCTVFWDYDNIPLPGKFHHKADQFVAHLKELLVFSGLATSPEAISMEAFVVASSRLRKVDEEKLRSEGGVKIVMALDASQGADAEMARAIDTETLHKGLDPQRHAIVIMSSDKGFCTAAKKVRRRGFYTVILQNANTSIHEAALRRACDLTISVRRVVASLATAEKGLVAPEPL